MRACFASIFLTALACAQDPYTTAPKNYQLEFENEYVRVSRVKYEPGEKVAVHTHPSYPTAYVYLTDAGPIRFVHITPKITVQRAAVKAGGVRFNYNPQPETHETEYLGKEPCEYLRIELKTPPAPPHRDARLRNDTDFPWEDAQVRISRARGSVAPKRPAVIVNITDRSFAWFDPKTTPPPTSDGGLRIVVELLGELQVKTD
jgi:hypothetical protein